MPDVRPVDEAVIVAERIKDYADRLLALVEQAKTEMGEAGPDAPG